MICKARVWKWHGQNKLTAPQSPKSTSVTGRSKGSGERVSATTHVSLVTHCRSCRGPIDRLFSVARKMAIRLRLPPQRGERGRRNGEVRYERDAIAQVGGRSGRRLSSRRTFRMEPDS